VKVTVALPLLVNVTVRLLVVPTGRLPGLAMVVLTSTGCVVKVSVPLLLVVLLSGTLEVVMLLVTVAPLVVTGTVTVTLVEPPGGRLKLVTLTVVPGGGTVLSIRLSVSRPG
jgi:hypothetical protein